MSNLQRLRESLTHGYDVSQTHGFIVNTYTLSRIQRDRMLTIKTLATCEQALRQIAECNDEPYCRDTARDALKQIEGGRHESVRDSE